METEVRKAFAELYGKDCLVVAAPGRVNLIGEHTDYNLGYVLPGAIDKRIYVGVAKNNSNQIRVYAEQFREQEHFSIDDETRTEGWSTYFHGMVFFLQQKGHKIEGTDVYFNGDVPVGAGMSSSAALCSAFGLALVTLYDLPFTRMEIAVAAQQTEHRFALVQVGIMDQFASLHGKKGHLIKLDCRSMEYQYIPFNFPDYRIVLVNTMVTHSLASSEYNVRRKQCEEGVEILQAHDPSIRSLRDVNIGFFEKYKSLLSPIVERRCRFVIEENDRLLKGCALLETNDLVGFGQLMYIAHDGLRFDYEVSCPESDFLVEQAKAFGLPGARQMGGGFGGCTINIIPSIQVEAFSNFIEEKYIAAFEKKPDIYITQIEDGAKVI